MPTALNVGQRFGSALAAVGFIVRALRSDDPAAAPTISSGSGAPSAAEPDGSLYLRTGGAADTTLYIRASGAWVALEGAGGASTVTTLTATTTVLAAATELTIASGAVTVTQSRHTIDTEGDASTDDLTTINGGTDGQLLWLTAASGSRDVVIKHGDIKCPGGTDITLATDTDIVQLMRVGEAWVVIAKRTAA